MDIETIKFNNIQIPIAISFAYINNIGFEISKLILIDHNLLQRNENLAIKNLFENLFKELINVSVTTKYIIFMHNLGSFDGYILYKYLIKYYNDNLNCLIDHHNKFIEIELKINGIRYIWKDSMRIFNISLNELCENFDVKGKLSEYNPKFNNIELFFDKDLFNKFKNYCVRDSNSLLKALTLAQETYLMNFNVDITSIWSTSTLSLKIFRLKFLNDNIPILSSNIDSFVRNSYLGGASDYYFEYGENINYYDVNSLYPHAMLNPMPFNLIKFHKDLTNVKLEDFFGYCLVKVYCSNSIEIPLLPYKYNGKTIFPTGE